MIKANFVDVISGRKLTIISEGPICYPSMYTPIPDSGTDEEIEAYDALLVRISLWEMGEMCISRFHFEDAYFRTIARGGA